MITNWAWWHVMGAYEHGHEHGHEHTCIWQKRGCVRMGSSGILPQMHVPVLLVSFPFSWSMPSLNQSSCRIEFGCSRITEPRRPGNLVTSMVESSSLVRFAMREASCYHVERETCKWSDSPRTWLFHQVRNLCLPLALYCEKAEARARPPARPPPSHTCNSTSSSSRSKAAARSETPARQSWSKEMLINEIRGAASRNLRCRRSTISGETSTGDFTKYRKVQT